jgi:hypothetical protein
MDAAALVLVALLAAAAVVFVARPFLREPVVGAQPREPEQATLERLRLSEQRDRALAALKELEFDHRTGKICDGDYRELVGPLRREAAEALRQLDDRARQGATRRREPSSRPAGAARAGALARTGGR